MATTPRRTGALVLAALVLYLVLVQPNHPAAMTWRALAVFPLELPVILLGLAAIGPGRIGTVIRLLLVPALTIIAVLKTADFAAFTALSRGFNPVADLPLVDASVRLLAGTVGPLAAAGAVAGALLVIVLLAALLWWATGVWTRVDLSRRAARLSGAAAVLAACVAGAEIAEASRAWNPPVSIPGAAFTARLGIERVELATRTVAELRVFRAAAATDPFAGSGVVLDAIGRDVMVVFVESYGRTSIDTPYYAEVHRQTLAEAEARLLDLGLAMRSGYLGLPHARGAELARTWNPRERALDRRPDPLSPPHRERARDAVPHRRALGVPHGRRDARDHPRLARSPRAGFRHGVRGKGPRLSRASRSTG